MVKYTLWDNQEVDVDIVEDVFPTDDEIKKMEAAMPGCEHGWFESSSHGEAQLHYRKFLPSGSPPKGVVVYMHGILGQSGNAFILKNGRKVHTALSSEELTKAGYALYALDMLGHGYSEGVRWYVPDWKVNRDDLDNFARFAAKQHDGVPLLVFGESYGANLVLNMAKEWQMDDNAPAGFAGIVLLAPFIKGDMPPAPVVAALRYGLAPLFPKWTPFFMPNPITADKIWRDEEVRALHTEPRWLEMGLDGGGRAFRLGTAVSMLNAMEAVQQDGVPGLNVPFCAIHGEKDVPVPIEGTDYLEQHAITPEEDRSVYRIEGAYHDLLGDPVAEKTMEYMIKFMDERVEKMSNPLPN